MRTCSMAWLGLGLLWATGCGSTNDDDDDAAGDGDADADADADGDADVCGPGVTLCAEECVDTDLDPRHCGGCGTVCRQDEECAAGDCVLDCAVGATDCEDACADLETDPTHCGDCETRCGEGEICVGGACVLNCLGETTACGDACVDVTTDPEHCGDCDVACGALELCSGGLCLVDCSEGLLACGLSCVDPATDPAHCGGCDDACAFGEGCEASACVNRGCVWGIEPQVLRDDMVGCASTVTFPDRATLCADGWAPCTALEWASRRGGDDVPAAHYWTNDNLRYTSYDCTTFIIHPLGVGGEFDFCSPGEDPEDGCWVDEVDGTACPENEPMRVCAPAREDPVGNVCNWWNCGYEAQASANTYFGGCAGNSTAGTLCCR